MRICDREEQRSENIDRVLSTLITSLKGYKIILYELKALQILPMDVIKSIYLNEALSPIPTRRFMTTPIRFLIERSLV